MPRLIVPTLTIVSLLAAGGARATTLAADPTTYRAFLAALEPGDTLALGPGHYPRLNLTGLAGTEAAPITITGPASGTPAVIDADPGPCCNTVQLDGSAYLVLRNLTIDGGGVAGADGINAKGAPVHDIVIEDNLLVGHDGSQSTVAISTKTTAWSWVIRRNRIIGAGTGMYLGNSDGTMPFVGGIIENNLVDDPIGYCIQVKWQGPRPSVAGLPSGPSRTVIRHNVLRKTDRPSEDGDRPNLLVGGFPMSGAGSTDRYEIYGNLILHNPREALLQASGRVSIHDNVFLDAAGTAIVLANHDLPLRQATVYNNTVFGAARAISVSGLADQGTWLVGNALFADQAISGAATTTSENVTGTVDAAMAQLVAPARTLPADLHPKAGALLGAALDLSPFAGDLDRDYDFDGSDKAGGTRRGAYATEVGGWPLSLEPKPASGSAPRDGGVPVGPTFDAGAPGDAGQGATDGSCAFARGGASAAGILAMLLALFAFAATRRSSAR